MPGRGIVIRNTYRSALILGFGISGRAAASLLRGEGVQVTVVDRADSDDLRRQAAAGEAGLKLVLGANDLAPMLRGPTAFDVCIVSPGIASDSEWVRAVETAGIPVIGELELGASRCHCRLVAVTGSKGKSTAVKLCAEALALAGRRVEAAGNYGTALCEVAARSHALDWVVVEVSSFQLELVREFCPAVGVLLNLQPDHLDRHGSMEKYTKIKSNIFRRMTDQQVAVVLDEDISEIRRQIGRESGKEAPRWVSFGTTPGAEYRFLENRIICPGAASSPEGSLSGAVTVDLNGTMFANRILGAAGAAVCAAVSACGAPAQSVGKAARTFEPLPHRMMAAGEIGGVRFVDDSKGTSLSALAAALEMSTGRVRLIAGGLLKERSLDSVKEMLEKRAVKVYLIGRAAKDMMAAWSGHVECCVAERLESAVRQALAEAAPGETILLSPGCASFDQFRNFEDRGEQFVKIVKGLQEASR